MTEYILALDQGTTSTRSILFNHRGQVVCASQKEHKQIYPKPGWVEHDPMEIWERTQEVLLDSIISNSINPGMISAVGITNQRETTLVWNRHTGRPYYNAIVWQDTRTKDICDDLSQDGGQDRFRSKTGLPLSTYFSGLKIKWIFDNIEGVKEDAEKGNVLFGNIDTWLIWWLTGGPNGGVHVTDVTNASRTMLMNLETLSWDPEILEVLNLPLSILPRIGPSSDPSAWGTTSIQSLLTLRVPICGDLGDQQAALVGQTCFDPGEVKNTYGTGCFMLMNTGISPVPSNYGLLTTLAYKFGNSLPCYALEGSVAITGALVQWLRDNLGLITKSSEIELLANTVEDNGGIYFVPAFSGLFAPYWKSDARGIIIGLTRYINKGHLARAALEATAYQTCEILEAMEMDSHVSLSSLKVDGGMVHNELLMQFQADLLNVPVIRPKVSETTALGAAYAAGLAIGFWDSLKDLINNWEIDRKWQPKMEESKRKFYYNYWKKAVVRSFGWVD